jgi:uncharacterized membrane protein
MLVLGFVEDELKGEILPELRRLKELDIVRLIDLLVVTKDEAGAVDVHQISDLGEDEAVYFGALVGALVGLGSGSEETTERAALAGAEELADGHVFDEDSVWFVSDAIPAGSAAAVALIEHRWAIPLRDKIVNAGGLVLADEWVHPADLIAAGVAASAAQTSGAVGS